MLGELLMVTFISLSSSDSSSYFYCLVEDESHSDFIALRNMLIKTNLNDLRDVTHNIHYENYRYKKLNSFVNSNSSIDSKTGKTSSINK
jgi:septin family protein